MDGRPTTMSQSTTKSAMFLRSIDRHPTAFAVDPPQSVSSDFGSWAELWQWAVCGDNDLPRHPGTKPLSVVTLKNNGNDFLYIAQRSNAGAHDSFYVIDRATS
eukprot:gnl/Hemi2/28215_TR9318_c0_g1_i1.p2 gnl/Hemi2/28215_TR9318_c0_g1~~gnl/Hemi2/28215_TR9318_c0_g1_i1.p2  ORF type:complete len:103 (+),score=22.55 gnl/Hemi2/28215_TR9318_c0_g1_i1:277-585(+)